ncbi:uncharacterized protein LOC124337231 [Daphnia pulicaria]|uniref:uncharacterized protein LOC124337231 n=1 Tax=Daphnia pulicaria TaxID=35523 RepID=UPI001EEBEF16|nr:uncharacterized protein LOC124337231 [Daphnia pulicaria]
MAIATAVHYLSSIDSSPCNQFVIMINYGVVLLLGRPRVYRCLLDTVAPSSPKRLSTTLRLPSTTPSKLQTTSPRLQLITPQRGQKLHRSAQVLLCPELLHAAAPSYYVGPKYYTEAPVYYTTTNAAP